MITFWRIIKTGLKNFARNLWLSTAATGIMAITLLVMFLFFVLNLSLDAQVKQVKDKIDVSIFLNDGIDQNQVKNFQQELQSSQDVKSVKYISKEEALAIYKGQNAENQKLLENITPEENPLPASLEIKANNPGNLDSVKLIIEKEEYKPLVRKSSYEGKNQETIQKIIKISDFIKKLGLTASLLFLVISLLIIFNTIRMAIFTRKEEIEIMKLVGATKWFIRWPFVVEGSLYGVLGAFISITLTYAFIALIGPVLSQNVINPSQMLSFFSANFGLIFGAELSIGIFVGALSSGLAITRHLKL